MIISIFLIFWTPNFWISRSPDLQISGIPGPQISKFPDSLAATFSIYERVFRMLQGGVLPCHARPCQSMAQQCHSVSCLLLCLAMPNVAPQVLVRKSWYQGLGAKLLLSKISVPFSRYQVVGTHLFDTDMLYQDLGPKALSTCKYQQTI